MYIPTSFRIDDRDVIAQFIARHGFAALVSHTRDGLVATHLPFLLERCGDRDVLSAHMARTNPHWRHFDGQSEAMVIFQGPHGYVSPSWYATSPAVPTWNYTVVHVHGRPRVVETRDRVRSILERVVAAYESPRREPWDLARLPTDYIERMIDAIVGFEIDVERVEAKFKLSQNRSNDDIAGVIAGLTSESVPEDGALVDFTRRELARKA